MINEVPATHTNQIEWETTAKNMCMCPTVLDHVSRILEAPDESARQDCKEGVLNAWNTMGKCTGGIDLGWCVAGGGEGYTIKGCWR